MWRKKRALRRNIHEAGFLGCHGLQTKAHAPLPANSSISSAPSMGTEASLCGGTDELFLDATGIASENLNPKNKEEEGRRKRRRISTPA